MNRSRTRVLGQHMLVNLEILDKIIDQSHLNKAETVCEVGTGNGILTYELCRYANSVLSFELDNILFQKAIKKLHFLSNLTLINADAFRVQDLNFNVFVSNLPYAKSKDAFTWLPFQKFNRAIIMIQKEFAGKLQANPGQRNYRAISVITQYCFKIQELFDVDRKAFDPEPSIESVVIRLTPKNSAITEQIIKSLNLLFSQKNKKTSSLVKKFGIGVNFAYKRISELDVEELVELARDFTMKRV